MSRVRTEPTGFTAREIAAACRSDAPFGMRMAADRHTERVVELADRMLSQHSVALTCEWDSGRIHREIVREYRTMIGPLSWVVISAVINWIVRWYLDLIFGRPEFAPWSPARRGAKS